MSKTAEPLPPGDSFAARHIGPRADDVCTMLNTLGYDSLDTLIDAVVPSDIRLNRPLTLPPAQTEGDTLVRLRTLANKNRVWRTYIGMGYSDCITPPVILRNILENPGWYTAYTPYQPEIAQGRLEALLNFQTVVSDLTSLEIANASLLDEATAAAEAMTMTHAVTKHGGDSPEYLVDTRCHPQTIAVVRTRAAAQGVAVVEGNATSFAFSGNTIGALVQYPTTEGAVVDYRSACVRAHEVGALVTAATDLLSLVLLMPPGEWGADIAIGNAQRFGVPLGYGGPHAAFFATKDRYKRNIPGRIIGVSKDASGRQALRMALQTREQHIRRDKATSNICTAQVLLAVISGAYAAYHGPAGLQRIATRVHRLTAMLARGLEKLGYKLEHQGFFDTITIRVTSAQATAIQKAATDQQINLRMFSDSRIGIALDETVQPEDVGALLTAFSLDQKPPELKSLASTASSIPEAFARTSPFLQHPVFHQYHSETEMLRYLKRLEDRDLSLTSAMIPLGSCTMKLNATTEMIPVTWPEYGAIHPFAPPAQAQGYAEMFRELEEQLAEITGFDAVSLQPNAGSQGEFTGLLVVREYHRARGDTQRTRCLIPQSAHGTNPASAVMAGMQVVVVKTDAQGNIDTEDLRAKAEQYRDTLGAFMVTYPSTHGVFEASIREVCRVIHNNGGLVYMDGANMNAQVGLCRPADIGADVCHLNLHKTFCIPHGGGGPGMGPIGVTKALAPYLPDHPVIPLGVESPCGTVSAAPWGSPSIVTISWAYLQMMGATGLTDATKISILNANYIARRLEGHYDLLYSGANGLIGHECIIDTRPFKNSADVSVEDIAKRLIDYGFHPPTISFPVAGTMMIEPTESESIAELDRFCDAMISIRGEIREVETGEAERNNNLLSHSPHPLDVLLSEEWNRPYSRERAAFPSDATREHKIWPFVGRIDAAFGDRNLVCSCPPIESYAEEPVGASP